MARIRLWPKSAQLFIDPLGIIGLPIYIEKKYYVHSRGNAVSLSLSRFFENPPIYWIFCKLERSFLKFTSAAVRLVISLDGKRNSSFIQKMFKNLFF